MQLFHILALLVPELTPSSAKLHLATWNGKEEPLDVYLAGDFDEWQRWQRRRNFSRRFVISLIDLRETDKWLFAGIHKSEGDEWVKQRQKYHYKLTEVAAASEFNGRLVAHFERRGRQPYLNADGCADRLLLSEIRAERLRMAEFPGYRSVDLSYAELALVTKESIASWRAALSSVAGVYLISDQKTGKLYVGSASGEGGIWQRWLAYAATGHGGNTELRALASEDPEHVKQFRFSVLEIADVHESRDAILRRESHWKSVLLSRMHGHNAN